MEEKTHAMGELPPSGGVIERGYTPPSKCIHNKRKELLEEYFVNT
jgi:hypothetical protein